MTIRYRHWYQNMCLTFSEFPNIYYFLVRYTIKLRSLDTGMYKLIKLQHVLTVILLFHCSDGPSTPPSPPPSPSSTTPCWYGPTAQTPAGRSYPPRRGGPSALRYHPAACDEAARPRRWSSEDVRCRGVRVTADQGATTTHSGVKTVPLSLTT